MSDRWCKILGVSLPLLVVAGIFWAMKDVNLGPIPWGEETVALLRHLEIEQSRAGTAYAEPSYRTIRVAEQAQQVVLHDGYVYLVTVDHRVLRCAQDDVAWYPVTLPGWPGQAEPWKLSGGDGMVAWAVEALGRGRDGCLGPGHRGRYSDRGDAWRCAVSERLTLKAIEVEPYGGSPSAWEEEGRERLGRALPRLAEKLRAAYSDEPPEDLP